ncbi:chemotaxis protein CheX [Propionivibrio sp.]|uniref:chemotaxis protein CheX n=1 Tax=Propionivibrio sp. TaxID=2212460 RepID=UPI003BF30005
MTGRLISKVLVLDSSPEHSDAIKQFCDENNLVGLKVRKNRLMSVLRSNIDLGAILYSDSYGASPEENAEIAIRIHTVRPELPIFLRRDSEATLDDINESLRRVFCAAYTTNDLPGLSQLVDKYIFSLVYPNALVRGISEITESILASQFKQLTTRWDTPYIVHDKVIFGEVFSLIPLESAWCRGYMMLQTEEQPILDSLDTHAPSEDGANFRTVNSLLGEITNLIWGAFKNRYIGDAAAASVSQIQVPLIINHKHKYISFGTENPQLCFLYTLTDEDSGKTIKLYQRFVFNLSWSPEDFKEIVNDTSDLVDSGELELF